MSDIVEISVVDIEKKRLPSKHYVYEIVVTRSDGSLSVIQRRYSRFFELQCRILDRFPVEGGKYNPSERIIPFLPGKILFGRSQVRAVALKRLQSIDMYCKDLLKLRNVMDSPEVAEFFSVTEEDLNPAESGEKMKENRNNIEFEGKEISGPILNEQYVAISTYTQDGPQEVSLTAGEIVDVIEKSENGWWFVSADDGQGWAPSSYLERTDGQEEDTVTPLQIGDGTSYVSTKNYVPQFDDEVRLNKGMPVEVLEKNLNGWWKVRCGGKTGKAPATFLVKTGTVRAKKVMDIADKFSSEAKLPHRPEKNMSTANHLVGRPTQDVVTMLPLSPPVTRRQQPQLNGLFRPNTDNSMSESGPKILKKIMKNKQGAKGSAADGNNEKAKKPLPDLPNPAQRTKPLLAPPVMVEAVSDEEDDYINVPPPPRRNTVNREFVKVNQTREEPIYIAVSDFTGHAPGTIDLEAGVQVKVMDKNVTGWSYVQIGSLEGWVPTDIIKRKDPVTKKISPARPPPPKSTSSAQNTQPVVGRAISPKPAVLIPTTQPARATSPRPLLPIDTNELQQKLNARRAGKSQEQGRALSPRPPKARSPVLPSLPRKPAVIEAPVGRSNPMRWAGPLAGRSQNTTHQQPDSDSDSGSDKEYTNDEELEKIRTNFVKKIQNKPRGLPVPPSQANKPRPVLPQKKPILPKKPKPGQTNGLSQNDINTELNVRAMRNRFEQS